MDEGVRITIPYESFYEVVLLFLEVLSSLRNAPGEVPCTCRRCTLARLRINSKHVWRNIKMYQKFYRQVCHNCMNMPGQRTILSAGTTLRYCGMLAIQCSSSLRKQSTYEWHQRAHTSIVTVARTYPTAELPHTRRLEVDPRGPYPPNCIINWTTNMRAKHRAITNHIRQQAST